MVDGVPEEVPVGFLSFTTTHDLQLNARSLDYKEQVTISQVVTKLRAIGARIALASSCGGTCTPVGNNFPVGDVMQNGLHGTLTFHDSVGRGDEEGLRNMYTWLVLPVADPEATITQVTPLFYRCDDDLRGFAGPGCVFPEATPAFLVSRAVYGASAAMIQWAQDHLSAHWGDYALGGKPLTRLANTEYKKDNRRIICQRAWKAFPRWTADNGKIAVKDSCDEFPFASTYQSGAMVDGQPDKSFSGAQCAQVEAVKTADSGSVAAIWNNVQVVPGTTYSASARCVRGHIPLSLNEELGRDAWNKFIGAERLLDGDGYWLTVTQ